MRLYTVDPSRDGVAQFKGGIHELYQRFRDGEAEAFKQSGVNVRAVWRSLDDPNTLLWARQAGWAAFNAGPKWTEWRTKYFAALTATVFFLSATDYSPLK